MSQRTPKEWETDFYAGRRTEEVPFALNDYVKVISGPLVGRYGSIITVMPNRPELSLVVEIDWGNDEVVAASDLELAFEDSGD